MDLSVISESCQENVSRLVIQMLAEDRNNFCGNYSVLSEILASSGINSQEFLGAIEHFWMDIREYNRFYIIRNDDSIRNFVRKMLISIRSAIIALANLDRYLNVLVKGIEDSIKFNYDEQVLDNTLLKVTTEMALLDSIYSLSTQEASVIYDNILYEDSFLSYLSYICIRVHHSRVHVNPKFMPMPILDFFRRFQTQLLPYLSDKNLEPEKKIIGRLYCINNFKNWEIHNESITDIIKKLKKRPLALVSSERLAFFYDITKSRVIKEAIDCFSDQTLLFPNPPFTNVEEAQAMFSHAFTHIVSSNKTFYSNLYENAPGLTVYEYVFLNKNLQTEYLHNNACVLITLLHEAAHLYKRVTPSGLKNSPSPSTTVVINGISENKPEDGWRLENIIFPGLSGEIYREAAEFLITRSSWDQSLKEFTDKFKAIQKEGQDLDEPGFRYRETNRRGPVRCLRMTDYGK